MPGGKKKQAGWRKAVLSGPRSPCATASVQTLRTLTFYNPSVEPGGSNTLAGTGAPTKLLQIQELQVKFLIKTPRPVVECKWFAAQWRSVRSPAGPVKTG